MRSQQEDSVRQRPSGRLAERCTGAAAAVGNTVSSAERHIITVEWNSASSDDRRQRRRGSPRAARSHSMRTSSSPSWLLCVRL